MLVSLWMRAAAGPAGDAQCRGRMLIGGVDMPRSLAAVVLLLSLAAGARAGTEVTLETMFGDVTIELYDDVAPATCRNFLTYVYSDRYEELMFHRGVSGFIVQTGGFYHNGAAWDDVATDPPVVNEFNVSNTRGTVAMAKLGGDPDSATSQFFVNLADNSANLDYQNGGFTVFGEVTLGMDIIDYIGSLPTYDLTSYFYPEPWYGAMDEVPLYTHTDGMDYFVMTDVTAPAPHPGDANFDGAVDVYDLAALANHYGLPGDMSWMDADFDGDDTVGVYDLATLANNYGWAATGSAGGDPVPEPASAALLLAGTVLLTWRRRHARRGGAPK